MLILHAYLHTMEEQDFPDGYLRFLEGRITALGPMEEAPQPETGRRSIGRRGRIGDARHGGCAYPSWNVGGCALL